jgi:hypothetical protein
MLKILLGTGILLMIGLPATAQLHFPEYTDEQVDLAARRVCGTLNNGRRYSRGEAMILVKISASNLRDLSGIPDDMYASIDDRRQEVRNANRIVDRLNRSCRVPQLD